MPVQTGSSSGVVSLRTHFAPLSLAPRVVVAMACVCAAAGLLSVWTTFQALMGIWQSDALKSVGMVVPLACFALILRDWRTLGWETDGTWWGFALLAVTALLVFIRDQTLLIITVNKDWLLQIPPLPLIAVVYAASFVLLFGGTRLLRKAWFPVLLMWAVIPVPQMFSSRIDLPLQHAGALVARNFARAIGIRLNSSDLHIMFTPDTGMFIAPGCNGLRGSITMGLVAIVVAYYYRFRWRVFVPVVAGGILLGYAFNFVRLCSLVLFDRLAVRYPRLQPHDALADHVIGACLFVAGVSIFLAAIEKLKQRQGETSFPPVRESSMRPWSIVAKTVAVLLLAAAFGADYLRNGHVEAVSTSFPALPASIGPYHQVRTWQSQTAEGVVVYLWGEYAAPDTAPGASVLLGISPRMSVHDAEVCHIARGLDPSWHGQIDAASPSGTVELTSAMYNDGALQMLEASTVCDAGACRQYSQTGQHIALIYAQPHKELPMQGESTRPTPVLIKVETSDTTTPISVMEPRLAAVLTQFLKTADLVQLTQPYNKR